MLWNVLTNDNLESSSGISFQNITGTGREEDEITILSEDVLGALLFFFSKGGNILTN